MGLSTILDYAIDYHDRGFSVIPIRPGPEKKPYLPWTEFQKTRATEEQIEAWFKKWPDANIAIITGSISGIFVVDGDGEIGSRWISENLPKTSVYAKTGRKAGCHCFYRIPAGALIKNQVNWKPKVDIRGEGGYVIAAPSIHHTGNVYELIIMPGLSGWDDLTEFNPQSFEKKSGSGNLSGFDFSKVKTIEEKKANLFKSVASGGRNNALAGMCGAMFRAGGQPAQVWDAALAWNSNNKPPLGEAELKRTIKQIWELHLKNDPIKIFPDEAPLKSEIEQVSEKIKGPITDEYPIDCLQPGGILQEIMDYTEKSSASHKPIFALSAAIAIIGNICGQRIMTETGLRTNMYCVSIGYSGAGKDASHSAISSILAGSSARISLGPTDTASGVALLKWLSCQEHQISLFTFDEFGMLLQGTKNQNSPMAELPRILTKIFSSTDRPEIKSYADAKLNITIPWHHLSLYASSTPSKFWGNLSEADSVSGFLARILIFEAHDEIERARESIASAVPKKLMEKIDCIWAITPPIDPDRGDVARVPIPFVVPRSKEAKTMFLEWSEEYWKLRNEFREDDCKASIYGRAAEHCAKLALIHAVSLREGKIVGKEVGPESIAWAIKVTDACINRMLSGISRNIAKNVFHGEQQRVLNFLRKSKKDRVSAREIYRNLRVSSRMANDVITSLLITGEISQEDAEGVKYLKIG